MKNIVLIASLISTIIGAPLAIAQTGLDSSDSTPLSRVREGGTPYDPNQSLEPYTISIPRSLNPNADVIASPPEYDPVKGVLYRYSSSAWPNVVRDLVVKLTENPDDDEIAYVVVSNSSQQTSATNLFSAAGADMSKVEFLVQPSNSIWMRDYGPHFVWLNDTLTVADSHYYPSRTSDNFIPTTVGELEFKMRTEHMGLYYSGGNFQPGPNRSGFVTALVNLDNPTSEGFSAAMIEEIYNQFQGIDTLHVVPQLPFSVDGTGHIDMWMYLIDEETVIISEFVPGSNQTAINVTNNTVPFMESLGYTVHRPMAWNSGGVHYTYANAFRVNDRIFIPCFGNQLEPGGNPSYNDEDAFALQKWEEAVAGKGIEIVPIQCIDIIPASGAIHCIVKQVPRYTAPDPAAYVIKPQVGDLWIAGYPQKIEWSATDFDNEELLYVELSYSLDDGDTWNTIIQWPDTGSYEWTPTETSDSARIRIEAFSTGGGSPGVYVSDPFKIANGTQTVYDFSTGGGIDKFVFGYQTTSWNSVAGNLNAVVDEVLSSDYSKMATSDATGGDGDANRYRSPFISSGQEATHIFEFQIAEDASTISEIEIQWEGYADRCTQAELYIWDFVANQWGDASGQTGQNRYLDSFAGNWDRTLSGTVQDISRYLDANGNLYFMVYAERVSDETFHDYAAVIVKQGDAEVVLNEFNVFRGILQSGGFTEVADSDDQYVVVNPGFVLNELEAPVWLEFTGNSPTASPTQFEFEVESMANTPSLALTTEFFNYDTQEYEVINVDNETFGSDSIKVISAAGDQSRFVESGTGTVLARVGWRANGFVIVFPWSVSVDSVSWTAE